MFDTHVSHAIFQLTCKETHLESLINRRSQQIDSHTVELDVVSSKKEIKSNDIANEQNKCDLFKYTACSSTVLKRHVTMKHKKDVHSLDIPTMFTCEICQHEIISTSGQKLFLPENSEIHIFAIFLVWKGNFFC